MIISEIKGFLNHLKHFHIHSACKFSISNKFYVISLFSNNIQQLKYLAIWLDDAISCLNNSLQSFFLVVRIFAVTSSAGSHLWPVIFPCMPVSLRNEVWLLENLFTVLHFFIAHTLFNFVVFIIVMVVAVLISLVCFDCIWWIYSLSFFFFRIFNEC